MKYLFLLILAFPVMGSGNHNTTIFTEGQKGDTGAPGKDGKDSINSATLYKGVAAGLAASQHQFGFYTPKLQWSIATGQFDNEQAFSMGLGKRIGDVLINGSIVKESDEIGYGIGLSGHF